MNRSYFSRGFFCQIGTVYIGIFAVIADFRPSVFQNLHTVNRIILCQPSDNPIIRRPSGTNIDRRGCIYPFIYLFRNRGHIFRSWRWRGKRHRSWGQHWFQSRRRRQYSYRNRSFIPIRIRACRKQVRNKVVKFLRCCFQSTCTARQGSKP